MNKNLIKAIRGAEQIDAMMFAFENTYLDVEVSPEHMERANRGVCAFYALWDAVESLRIHLDNLAGDEKVVNVIRAAHEERHTIRTLKDDI